VSDQADGQYGRIRIIEEGAEIGWRIIEGTLYGAIHPVSLVWESVKLDSASSADANNSRLVARGARDHPTKSAHRQATARAGFHRYTVFLMTC
jgi:hypothetical protein